MRRLTAKIKTERAIRAMCARDLKLVWKATLKAQKALGFPEIQSMAFYYKEALDGLYAEIARRGLIRQFNCPPENIMDDDPFCNIQLERRA